MVPVTPAQDPAYEAQQQRRQQQIAFKAFADYLNGLMPAKMLLPTAALAAALVVSTVAPIYVQLYAVEAHWVPKVHCIYTLELGQVALAITERALTACTVLATTEVAPAAAALESRLQRAMATYRRTYCTIQVEYTTQETSLEPSPVVEEVIEPTAELTLSGEVPTLADAPLDTSPPVSEAVPVEILPTFSVMTATSHTARNQAQYAGMLGFPLLSMAKKIQFSDMLKEIKQRIDADSSFASAVSTTALAEFHTDLEGTNRDIAQSLLNGGAPINIARRLQEFGSQPLIENLTLVNGFCHLRMSNESPDVLYNAMEGMRALMSPVAAFAAAGNTGFGKKPLQMDTSDLQILGAASITVTDIQTCLENLPELVDTKLGDLYIALFDLVISTLGRLENSHKMRLGSNMYRLPCDKAAETIVRGLEFVEVASICRKWVPTLNACIVSTRNGYRRCTGALIPRTAPTAYDHLLDNSAPAGFSIPNSNNDKLYLGVLKVGLSAEFEGRVAGVVGLAGIANARKITCYTNLDLVVNYMVYTNPEFRTLAPSEQIGEMEEHMLAVNSSMGRLDPSLKQETEAEPMVKAAGYPLCGYGNGDLR